MHVAWKASVEAVSGTNGDDFTVQSGKLVETGSGCQGSVVPV